MDATGPPVEYTLDETLGVFEETPGVPLTTSEVADELGCAHGTAYDKLETLVAKGGLETKKVGAQGRVWWRPSNHARNRDADARGGFEEAQFYELVRTVTNYAIFVLDSDGYIRTWNEGAKRIKGYDRDEIVGEHFSTFYTEADREAGQPERNLRKAAEQGRVEDEGTRVRKDGSTFRADITLTALRNDAGELQGYVKITRDVTERHEYEKRLKRGKERFETLVREVKDYAIFLLDPDGTVRTWNEGAKRLKGYAEDEIVGEHFSTFYTEADREAGRPERNLRKAAERGRVEDEGKRVRKDGTTFWANVTITALHDDDGGLRGFAKVTRDVTDRYEYERTIENERERLAFMNRIVRHNVLNGLNLVNARTEVLQERLADDAPEQEHLETIRRRVMDLSSLINTMRTFMDAVISESDHETEPVAIRDALERKLTLARESYPEAAFELGDLPDASTRVIGDDLIGEVFENVLSNAVIHNESETPRVEVWATETTRDVIVDAETGEMRTHRDADVVGTGMETRTRPAVAVHIADDGPGIPDEEKDAVLRKGVSEMETSGNGLGLYLVTELMDTYGGTVAVRDRDAVEDTPVDDAATGAVFDLVFLRADTEDEP